MSWTWIPLQKCLLTLLELISQKDSGRIKFIPRSSTLPISASTWMSFCLSGITKLRTLCIFNFWPMFSVSTQVQYSELSRQGRGFAWSEIVLPNFLCLKLTVMVPLWKFMKLSLFTRCSLLKILFFSSGFTCSLTGTRCWKDHCFSFAESLAYLTLYFLGNTADLRRAHRRCPKRKRIPSANWTGFFFDYSSIPYKPAIYHNGTQNCHKSS